MKTWNVGGLAMDYPMMIAAGVCKTPKSVLPYLHPHLPLGGVEPGTFTWDRRDGHLSGPLEFWSEELQAGANCYGLPNEGYFSGYDELANMTHTDGSRRHIIQNFAAFSTKQAVAMVDHHIKNRHRAPSISALTDNWGCPNTQEEETVPVAFNLAAIEARLEGWLTLCSNGCGLPFPLWVKLAQYLTADDLQYLPPEIDTSFVRTVESGFAESVAELISRPRYAGIVSAVIYANTIGNCMLIVDGKPVTKPQAGQAGLSGAPLKQFTLRGVKSFLGWLPPRIDTIACGGVLHGDDIADLLDIKAAAVQFASLPHFLGGAKTTPRLIDESERLQKHLG